MQSDTVISSELPLWPRISQNLPQAEFKSSPEDFVVIEELGFEPEGSGSHLWCWIEKQGIDTLQAIANISRSTGIHSRDIGYSGLKDRQAVTRQWISLPIQWLGHSALAQVQLDALAQVGIHVERQVLHPRKLKRGSHRSNRFVLTIRFDEVDRSTINSHWQRILEEGVPNYFGLQRFGFQGQNVSRARSLLAQGWKKKADRAGLMLSSARSYLFNQLLASRIVSSTWNQCLKGEVLNLNGSGSHFNADDASSDEIEHRLTSLDIHPTAPLWGSGSLESLHEARDLEMAFRKSEAELVNGLEKAGVKMSRRPLRLQLMDAQWRETADGACLCFTLTRGAYATAVLRELISAEGL